MVEPLVAPLAEEMGRRLALMLASPCSVPSWGFLEWAWGRLWVHLKGSRSVYRRVQELAQHSAEMRAGPRAQLLASPMVKWRGSVWAFCLAVRMVRKMAMKAEAWGGHLDPTQGP